MMNMELNLSKVQCFLYNQKCWGQIVKIKISFSSIKFDKC